MNPTATEFWLQRHPRCRSLTSKLPGSSPVSLPHHPTAGNLLVGLKRNGIGGQRGRGQQAGGLPSSAAAIRVLPKKTGVSSATGKNC